MAEYLEAKPCVTVGCGATVSSVRDT